MGGVERISNIRGFRCGAVDVSLLNTVLQTVNGMCCLLEEEDRILEIRSTPPQALRLP